MSNDNASWDPLEEHQTDAGLLVAAKKRQIRNILKSYVGAYDPFSELIQNAMDAVDLRETRLDEDNYEKKISITIDLQKNSFSITDNGLGFNEEEFRAFLAPNISFKDEGKTRGNKGVGSTYIAFGFNYLQLGTRTPDFEYVAEITNGRAWVEDAEGITTKPSVKKSVLLDSNFATVDRGSTFTIKFGGDKTRPKSLAWFGAEIADQWRHILLIKTPLGNVDFFDENPDKVKFDLTVISTDGTVTQEGSELASYLYPHIKIPASVNLKEVLDLQSKQTKAGKPFETPPKYLRLNGIYEFFGSMQLLGLGSIKRNSDLRELIETYKVTAYGYFAYSTEVWDELNDQIVKLKKGTRILRGGLQLANNFMTQGELLAIPLTSSIGYQNQTHVLVHFVNADPDLGRKGFQPELKELAEAISVAIVNRFKTWRRLLKDDTGARPNIAESDDVFDWINEQADYESSNPLVINNPNFFAPTNEISISSIPRSEQDVIVLFNQLIAGGVIRGLRLMATDQKKRYDGVFRYFVKLPIENHIYHQTNNPLGVEKLENTSDYRSRPWVLEYKFSFDALIRDLENDEKVESEINLVVCWEMGELWEKNHTVTSLLDVENLHHREFHGITHIIQAGGHRYSAIILSELIEYLNDFAASQLVQKERYATQ